MQKWEYKIVFLSNDDQQAESELNHLGEQGWELVATAFEIDRCYL